jgi:hypothetical protein
MRLLDFVVEFTRVFGGWPLVYSNAENRIWMGGGGGGGSSNLGSSPVAGRGGGIILIKANTIEGNGFAIRSNGENHFFDCQ